MSSVMCAGAFSDGRLLDKQEKPKLGGDGVKFLYQALVQRQPGLNQQTATPPHAIPEHAGSRASARRCMSASGKLACAHGLSVLALPWAI